MVLPGVALMNICQLALFLPWLSAGKYRTHNKNSMPKGKDRNEHTQFSNFSPSFSSYNISTCEKDCNDHIALWMGSASHFRVNINMLKSCKTLT